MNNTTIDYHQYYDGSKKFVFCFKDLDSYEVVVDLYDNCQIRSGFDGIDEITRLLNAMNVFRQWNSEQRYRATEIRRAIEDIARKNDKEGIFYKTYQFAILGTASKDWNKIIIEKS